MKKQFCIALLLFMKPMPPPVFSVLFPRKTQLMIVGLASVTDMPAAPALVYPSWISRLLMTALSA